MTRLYTSIFCKRCGKAYAYDVGAYFGKKIGDQNRTEGICFQCKFEEHQKQIEWQKQVIREEMNEG